MSTCITDSEKFWGVSPLDFFRKFNILPTQGMNLGAKLNSITKLVLLIFAIMLGLKYKYALWFLLISLCVICIVYLTFRCKHGEPYGEVDDRSSQGQRDYPAGSEGKYLQNIDYKAGMSEMPESVIDLDLLGAPTPVWTRSNPGTPPPGGWDVPSDRLPVTYDMPEMDYRYASSHRGELTNNPHPYDAVLEPRKETNANIDPYSGTTYFTIPIGTNPLAWQQPVVYPQAYRQEEWTDVNVSENVINSENTTDVTQYDAPYFEDNGNGIPISPFHVYRDREVNDTNVTNSGYVDNSPGYAGLNPIKTGYLEGNYGGSYLTPMSTTALNVPGNGPYQDEDGYYTNIPSSATVSNYQRGYPTPPNAKYNFPPGNSQGKRMMPMVKSQPAKFATEKKTVEKYSPVNVDMSGRRNRGMNNQPQMPMKNSQSRPVREGFIGTTGSSGVWGYSEPPSYPDNDPYFAVPSVGEKVRAPRDRTSLQELMLDPVSQVFLTNIGPDVLAYETNLQPINYNMGITETPINSPLTRENVQMTHGNDLVMYARTDPQLLRSDGNPARLAELPQPSYWSERYSALQPRGSYDFEQITDPNEGYGTPSIYASYNNIDKGDVTYYSPDVPPYYPVNFITRNKIDIIDYVDPMGRNLPEYHIDVGLNDIRDQVHDRWMEDTTFFREDLMERQLRKRNSEMWQWRVAPIAQYETTGNGKTYIQ